MIPSFRLLEETMAACTRQGLELTYHETTSTSNLHFLDINFNVKKNLQTQAGPGNKFTGYGNHLLE